MAYAIAGPIGHVAARSAKVPDLPVDWNMVKGPWFDNNLATLEVRGRGLHMWWATGVVDHGDEAHPRLEDVASVTVPSRREAALVSRSRSSR